MGTEGCGIERDAMARDGARCFYMELPHSLGGEDERRAASDIANRGIAGREGNNTRVRM